MFLKKNSYLLVVFSIFILLNCTIKNEPESSGLRKKLLLLTESLKGIPYRYGGIDIYGFDCSGLVYYVYGSFGINLPRTAREQAGLKKKVKFHKAKPGDILVFRIKGGFHTAVFLGKKSFIHAPSQGGVIKKEELNSYWFSRLKSVVNLLDNR